METQARLFDDCGSDCPDDALLTAARAGDNRAFDALVERYQEYLYRLMVRACHHPEDAAEVTADALVRAYEKLEQFEGRSSFISWLGRIGTNLCFRRREKKEPDVVPWDEMEEHASPAGQSPEQSALRAEMAVILRGAVAAIPEPDQTVLRLRDIENMSTQQVAHVTGLTESAVKSRLHRARGQLRARLNRYFLAEQI